MQQFNATLIAPNSGAGHAAVSSASEGVVNGLGAESSATQKFASHLNKLTEQLDGRRADNQVAGRKNEGQAVSELAKTMLQSADDEVSADDAWLSMVEELNSVAEGAISLEQVSSRHGVDVSALEAQLDEALAEFDGDIQALIAELQNVASGKALPPAANLDTSIADIKDLLSRVANLSADEQAEFAANVDDLVNQLTHLKLLQNEEDLAPGTAASMDSLKAELESLSADLQDQLQPLLAAESALTEHERAHLGQQLRLLEQLSELALADTIGTQQSGEEIAASMSAENDDIGELLSALQALFADGDERTAWLQQVDIDRLEAELSRLLDELDQDLDGVNRSELLATFEAQLSAFGGQNNTTAADAESNNASLRLEQIRELLTELNHKLELIQADTRVVDGSRFGESGSGLPPVAQALSMASQQLRAQLQQALQAQQSGGMAAEEDFEGDFENLRRLVSENGLNSSEQRSPSTTSQLGSSFQSALQNSQSSSPQGNLLSRDAAQQRSAEGPALSGFEAARQAQQAIDILGTGASERLRERVSVMFNSRTQAAEMRLDPPDLGRLSIRLNMNQEQASVSFQVTTPQAREALEQNLPRLRELLAEQGIALADANISEEKQSNSEQSLAGQAQSGQTDSNGLVESEFDSESELEVNSPGVVRDGRVDYFV